MQLTSDVQTIIDNHAVQYNLRTIEEIERSLPPLKEGINKQERIKYLQECLDELAIQYFINDNQDKKATYISLMVRKASQIRQIWNSYLGD